MCGTPGPQRVEDHVPQPSVEGDVEGAIGLGEADPLRGLLFHTVDERVQFNELPFLQRGPLPAPGRPGDRSRLQRLAQCVQPRQAVLAPAAPGDRTEGTRSAARRPSAARCR
ncbi:hypothetical protein AAW14_36695 [Streptomyces hygroscopicus]|nr:hypothetical protein [Streptomyces hygroscopicus]